jgi:F-type H+-transporting ATPase subunit gamma
MASGKEIKRRIASFKNTKKITKAMELVAASKMRKSVSLTLSSRPYATYAEEIIADVIAKTPLLLEQHPLLKKHAAGKTLMVLVTSNRGQCGAYNAQILRTMLQIVKSNPTKVYEFVVVGKKGEAALRRLGFTIVASFTHLPESVSYSDTLPIANFILSEFEQGRYDEVTMLATDFISALLQKPHVKNILPFDVAESKENTNHQAQTFTFEPSISFIFDTLIHKIFRIEIFQMILESVASEQSSRMVAMKNATDAAGDMISDLTLVYNKARQASITKEISEISAGMASVS